MWKYRIYFEAGSYYLEGSLSGELSEKKAQDSVDIIISRFEGMGLEANTWYLWFEKKLTN